MFHNLFSNDLIILILFEKAEGHIQRGEKEEGEREREREDFQLLIHSPNVCKLRSTEFIQVSHRHANEASASAICCCLL